MNNSVLFVDDEQNILDAYKRQLHKFFNIDTANSGKEALSLISSGVNYAVVISDMRMPEMDGITLLSKIRNVNPDIVRIMLTGNADMQTAIDAVNNGNIFRFMTKPSPPEVLIKNIVAGIKQHELITAEKELLELTLTRSISVLVDLLSIANPQAFGRASRAKHYAVEIATYLKLPDVWKYQTSALLSQIGGIIVSEDTMQKINKGLQLNRQEEELAMRLPTLAAELLVSIPRMQNIAEIIEYQAKSYDGGGIPEDSVKGEDIPLGARILKLVLDFDVFMQQGKKKRIAFSMLMARREEYDPFIVDAFEKVLGIEERKSQSRTVEVRELSENMILNRDVKTKDGKLLLTKGQRISRTIMEHLKFYGKTGKINNSIEVTIIEG